MQSKLQDTGLTYAQVRFLRCYKPNLRGRIERLLRERVALKGGQASALSYDEILACVSIAYDEMVREADEMTRLPEPDPDTMRSALEDFKAGRCESIDEVISKL